MITNIRTLYAPVQPTVKQTASNVSYVEFLPDAKLQPLIYCYWQLKTTEKLNEEFIYRVVADGCIDIYFELDNPHNSYVMGFCKQYTEFPLENSFNYVGVRFLPTMFPQLFGISAIELSDRFEELRSVIPSTSIFIANNLTEKLSPKQIKETLDRYFLKRLSEITFNNDIRLYGAIEIILNKSGAINIETELDTGISPRQLRRLFEFYVGDTAKTFNKIVRFQQILQAKPSQQSLKGNKLFLENGYYDQAHFIKEFKNLYGITPGKAF
ncbi:Helix-turn-helix domain protein [compost metagenome]